MANNTPIKFGITERGDVAFHDEWIAAFESNKVAAAILISKSLPRSLRGREAIKRYASRIVLHATTTGYGGTAVEPGVPPYEQRLVQLVDFLQEVGLQKDHCVIRVDPIFPTPKGVALAEAVIRKAYALGFRRFRYSWLDVYRHIRPRFEKAIGVIPPGLSEADPRLLDEFVNGFCAKAEQFGCRFESCAENTRHQAGCVSKLDFELCGLNPEDARGKSNQRAACMCCGNKTELLNHKGRCPHKCLYCYWLGD